MKTFMLTALIGLVAGAIDILPMIRMKIDKYATTSAFVFYFIMPFIILNINLFNMAWWLKGAVITSLLASPIMILVAKSDRKSVPIMASMSIILGTLIGIAGHFLVK